MNWEETIKYIRTKPSFNDLVASAYIEEDLVKNVERFGKSDEFSETVHLINKFAPKAQTILDIGCGNGITAINFSLNGYEVTAVEPDASETVGAGAIRKLINHYDLKKITVYESYAEEIGFKNDSFDLVYVRQAMHHANDLNRFLQECTRVLKPNGFLITIRDHVIYNKEDKDWFLATHPLQKFYGGENAYTSQEYRAAMEKAGLTIQLELRHFDSVINHFPMTKEKVKNYTQTLLSSRKAALKDKIGVFSGLPLAFSLYNEYLNIKQGNALKENDIPGRMYSYIAKKNA